MTTRRRKEIAAATVVALALLAACGGNGPSFTVNTGGWAGEWPWFWPKQSRFIVDQDFSRSVTVAGHGSIRLEAMNGEIVVTGQPGASTVTVTAELIVGSNVSRLDAESGLTQLQVIVSDASDEIVVRTLQPDDLDGRKYFVNYTVDVPSDLAVDVRQVNGHVTVQDVDSSLSVDVTNGNVYFTGIFEFATVRVGSGSIDGSVTLPSDGEILLSTVNGDIDLRVPTSTSAALSALVGFGAITWNDLDLLDAVHTSRSLTGTLGDGSGLIDLETTNGNVDVSGFDG